VSLIEDFFSRGVDRMDEGLNSDEFVVFYPSIAMRTVAGGDCRVNVRGRIYEERQLLRDVSAIAFALAGVPNPKALRELMGGLADDPNCVRMFKDRIKDFVLDGERDEHFEIDMCGTHVKSHRSNHQGIFGLGEPGYNLPAASLTAEIENNSWIRYTAKSESGRVFHGQSQLLHSHGVIVVSDIDDTIKDTNVPEPAELMLNTLFRPFRSTPRMAEIYKEWQQSNAQFIYLTNSPYQLFRPLAEYLQGEAGYPEGAYYMRYVEPADLKQEISNLVAFDGKVSTQENPKKHNLIPILEAFPESSFVLVGDSTEFDADVYTDLYLGHNFPQKFTSLRKPYSDRIKKIYIRDVKNSHRRKIAEDALARVQNDDVARFFDADKPDIVEKTVAVFQESLLRRGATA
jgi:phosphatidate phosphatase APP1